MVKSEIGAVDVVRNARTTKSRSIVELKTGFSLVAVSPGGGAAGIDGYGLYRRTARYRKGVPESAAGQQSAVPAAWAWADHRAAGRRISSKSISTRPRTNRGSRSRARRVCCANSPSASATPTMAARPRKGLVTAYRQDALRCLAAAGCRRADQGRGSRQHDRRQACPPPDGGRSLRLVRARCDRASMRSAPRGMAAVTDYAAEIAKLRDGRRWPTSRDRSDGRRKPRPDPPSATQLHCRHRRRLRRPTVIQPDATMGFAGEIWPVHPTRIRGRRASRLSLGRRPARRAGRHLHRRQPPRYHRALCANCAATRRGRRDLLCLRLPRDRRRRRRRRTACRRNWSRRPATCRSSGRTATA